MQGSNLPPYEDYTSLPGLDGAATREYTLLSRWDFSLGGSTGLVQMGILVTFYAESDEVLLGIVAQLAPGVDVVDLEVGRAAAVLAAPAIPL